MKDWFKIGSQPVQIRMAMTTHQCHRCPTMIRPGDKHLVITSLPSDLVSRPVQERECRRCVLTSHPRLTALINSGAETTRVVVEALAGEWADDLSFVSPAELAEQLLQALDGAR